MKKRREVLVYLPGVRWDDVPGTDRRLAEALASRIPVLWVDPPVPPRLWVGRPGVGALGMDLVADHIVRLRVAGPPGFTRPRIWRIAESVVRWRLEQVIRRHTLSPAAVVVSSPLAGFPAEIGGSKVLFVTDDWVGGADLMSIDRASVSKTAAVNADSADLVVAVSEQLRSRTVQDRRTASIVLANGCQIIPPVPEDTGRLNAGVAVLMGQLNERIDVDLVASVADRGIPVVVLGPRTERDPGAGRRLDRLLSHPQISYRGYVPPDQVACHLGEATVGLTPYTDTDFNRSSFPLKTLEYLAAGLPVVSTALPSVEWLGCPDIATAQTAEEFADLVEKVIAAEVVAGARRAAERRAFAAGHSWESRAETLLHAIAGISAGDGIPGLRRISDRTG